MKRIKQLISGLLAAATLCCACASPAENDVAAPKPVTVISLAEEDMISGFTDVPSDAWYAEAVRYCRENGVINGVSSSLFDPDGTLTRAQLVTILYRSEGEPAVAGEDSFTDTETGRWYSAAVVWASQRGLVAGYGNGLFGIDDPVTQEQLDLIFQRLTDAAVTGGIPGFDAASSAPATRVQAAAAMYYHLSGETGSTAPDPPNGDDAIVYMTTDISSDGLMAIYAALGRPADGDNVAVKLSMGEPGGHNFLQPDLIQALVEEVGGTIVDSNTAYGGRRASTALHYQTAEDHGFAAIAPVQILDEDGDMRIPVEGGQRLTENIVGGHFADYDFYVVLSHFKGHAMGGFGGAIKNISIGISSPAGKLLQHSGGHSSTSWGGGTQDEFLEAMAEAAKSVDDYMGDNVLYISVMNNLSVDCDCDSNPAEPDMHDIGILASTDPVALDQACVDLVYAAEDGQSLINRIESRNGIHTLEYAEEIGLGNRTYQIVRVSSR